jgi:hypothetical protein
VIVNLDGSGWDLVQALTANTPIFLRFVRLLNHTYLANDAQRFSEFLHPTQVAIVAIAILSNWDVEFDLKGEGINQMRKGASRIVLHHICHKVRLF